MASQQSGPGHIPAEQRVISCGDVDGILAVDSKTIDDCGILDEESLVLYLSRIGLTREDLERLSSPSPEALNLLTSAHCKNITWGNAGLHASCDLPSLDFRNCVERVVGTIIGRSTSATLSRSQLCDQHHNDISTSLWCFSVVPAFVSLLTKLGFRASIHVGAVGADPPDPSSWGNHAVVLVHFENHNHNKFNEKNSVTVETYIADVGTGEAPAASFLLKEGSVEVDGQRMRLVKKKITARTEATPDSISRGNLGQVWWWDFEDTCATFPGISFDFGTSIDPRKEGSLNLDIFKNYHRYYWTDPESEFVKIGVLLHRQTDEGLLSLHSCTLRRTHPRLRTETKDAKGYVVLQTVTEREGWFDLVKDSFFLDLRSSLTKEQQDRLWERVSEDHAAWLASKLSNSPSGNELATVDIASAVAE